MSYFKRKEFACKCGKCDFDTVDYELMEVLNDLRETVGEPLVITSGCRCPEHNKNVGGAKNSVHMTGKAADVRFGNSSKTPHTVIHEILLEKYPDKYGIAIGGSFVHIDTRSKKSRWTY